MTSSEQNSCPCCLGEGGWLDPIAEQSVICYLCHPEAYKEQAFKLKQDTGGKSATWVRGYPKMPCKHPGPLFVTKPWLFVVHSGSTSGDVARYMATIGGRPRKDGSFMKVSAHFNWSNELGGITQGVPLTHVSWHVGGSRIEYERLKRVWPEAPDKRLRKLNFCSYSIEMRGPAGRKYTIGEHNRVKDLVTSLRRINPQLRVATRHMDILATKKDPGRQFDMDIFKEIGMVVYG